MPQTIHHRLHILEAADWKAGIITLLEPESPYRPWRYAFGEARPGDYALLVLGTDPATVVTVLGRMGEDGGLSSAVLNRRYRFDIVDLTTLAMLLDLGDGAFSQWRIDDDDAERVILALHETPVYGDPYSRWGHSSQAAARNLLRFHGVCHGCHADIDLTAADARDRVHVHTVDPLPRPEPGNPIAFRAGVSPGRPYLATLREAASDWPAVICDRCRDRMRAGGFDSFVAFRFAQHPECPRCGAGRALTILYGEPVDPGSWGPWRLMGGCCRRDAEWHCDVCDHEWA